MPTPAPATSATWSPTPHPAVPLPTPGQLAHLRASGGDAEVARVLREREEAIARMEADPFNYGFELRSWARADRHWEELRDAWPEVVKWLLILGGNRASKSEWAAKRAVELCVDKPGSRVWCLHSTEASARQSQMPLIWKYLPPEWKPSSSGRMRSGVTTKICYTQATGFSDNTLVMPNGSQVWFKFYKSDVTTVEGTELDLAWADELVPMDWIKALASRLATRSGTGLVTFTPISGYTPVVGRWLDGATTIEDTAAEALPRFREDGTPAGHERVPLAVQAPDPRHRAIFFHTVENPFGGYTAVKEEAEKGGRNEILVRLYGLPQKVRQAQFPRFKESVHVIARDRVPNKGTWWQIVDPCNGRNFACLWLLATPDDRVVAAREWPQPGDYIPGVGTAGLWATTSTGKRLDGDPGPAQEPFGLSLEDYKNEFARVEKELSPDGKEPVEVHCRIMDSRFGNTATLARSESKTLIEEFADLGLEFIPAGGDTIGDGISLVNDLLAYDPTEEVSALNQPRLYFSEACQNTIWAVKHWTGQDGQKGACKDFVDLLRYGAIADPCYIPERAYHTVGGGSY